MKTISPTQLRAARALLNWSRAELSELTRISEPTLHRYENGTTTPEGRTKSLLFKAFDRHGIEFLEDHGVRFKPKSVDVYEGIDGFLDFFEFVYEHIENEGGDNCLNIYDESSLSHYRPEPEKHRAKMKMALRKSGGKLRVLTTKSDFNSHGYAEFRWIPEQPPMPTGFYALGNCLALISLADKNSPHVVVIHSAAITEGYRQGFNLVWKQAQVPPTSKQGA